MSTVRPQENKPMLQFHIFTTVSFHWHKSFLCIYQFFLAVNLFGKLPNLLETSVVKYTVKGYWSKAVLYKAFLSVCLQYLAWTQIMLNFNILSSEQASGMCPVHKLRNKWILNIHVWDVSIDTKAYMTKYKKILKKKNICKLCLKGYDMNYVIQYLGFIKKIWSTSYSYTCAHTYAHTHTHTHRLIIILMRYTVLLIT